MLDPLLKKSIDIYWLKPIMHAVEIYSDAMGKAGSPGLYRNTWINKEYEGLICKNMEDFNNNFTKGCVDHAPEIEFCLKKIYLTYFTRFKEELTSDSVQSALEYINEIYQEISDSTLRVTNRYFEQEWIGLSLRAEVKKITATILRKHRDICIEPLEIELKLLAKEQQQKKSTIPVTEPLETGADASNEAGNIENNCAILNLPNIEQWSDLCLGDATAFEIYISKKGHKGRNYSYVELHLGDKRRNSAKVPSKTWHAIRYYAFGAGKEHGFKKTDLLRANHALSRLFPSLHNKGNPFPFSKSGLQILKQDALSRQTTHYNDDFGGKSESECRDEADEMQYGI